MNTKRRSILMQAASIATPVLIIMGMRTMFAAGPAGASAADAIPVSRLHPDRVNVASVAAQPAKLTSQQQLVLDWRASLKLDSVLVSPMDSRIDVVLLPPTAPAEPQEQPQEPKVDLLEGLVLSGIIGNQNVQLATISGKVYRIGEQVRAGLTLTGVDVKNGSVTLISNDGQVLELVKAE